MKTTYKKHKPIKTYIQLIGHHATEKLEVAHANDIVGKDLGEIGQLVDGRWVDLGKVGGDRGHGLQAIVDLLEQQLEGLVALHHLAIVCGKPLHHPHDHEGEQLVQASEPKGANRLEELREGLQSHHFPEKHKKEAKKVDDR